MCIRRGDLRSPAGEHSSPLPCSENILMRTLLKRPSFVGARNQLQSNCGTRTRKDSLRSLLRQERDVFLWLLLCLSIDVYFMCSFTWFLQRSLRDHIFHQQKKDAYASFFCWCEKRDLNPYGVNHTPLKRARLPVPPLSRSPSVLRRLRYYTPLILVCQ